VKKTNALRLLDSGGYVYRTASYESGGQAVEATLVAAKIGMPAEQVFKTLVAVGDKTGPAVFVVPGDCDLDLKKAAAASGNKKVEMLPLRELRGLTGYERGGCSPFGMKKRLPTFVDESCELFDEIAVSAGVIGLQVALSPSDLLLAAEAAAADLT
jgi:Cys-tRNA(Pro)/Cys-tRNA(Cys) deacylase